MSQAQSGPDLKHETAITPQAVCRKVELLSAICSLLVDKTLDEIPSNPELAESALAPLHEHLAHPACKLVQRLLVTFPRDILIKMLVSTLLKSGMARPEGQMLCRALDDLSAKLLPVLEARTASEQLQLQQLVKPLLDGLAPSAEIARAVNTSLPMQFHIAPSLFLPLPQAGRHGVMLPSPSGAPDVYMFFGVPLTGRLKENGITRQWLQRGGWYYAVRHYIKQVEPIFAPGLNDVDRAAEAAVAKALPAYATGNAELIFKNHLGLALRYAPWKLANLPKEPFIRLADAHGFLLMAWFVEALEQYLDGAWHRGVPLAHLLPDIALAFRAQLGSLESLAKRPVPAVPNVISCAFLPRWADSARLVVPDGWLAPESRAYRSLQRVGQTFRMQVCSHSDWQTHPEWHQASAVLYGATEQCAEIGAILSRKGIHVSETGIQHGAEFVEGRNLTVYALDPESGPGSAWRLAVSSPDPELMLTPNTNRLMTLPYSAAIFRGDRLVYSRSEDPLATEFSDVVL